MTRLLDGVAEALAQMGAADGRLVTAVSGGLDSLVLLHALCQLVDRRRLVVAHLDHGIRADAADDAAFVRQTAVAWGVAFHGQRVDVPAFAQQQDMGLEEAGRMLRYRFLADVARCEGTSWVAVAHHADDQAETVLLHLLRGTGLAGLSGMLPASPLLGRDAVKVIRPLLAHTRAEIAAYGQAHQLAPRHDPTNDDTTYFRNRIRHELLPQLATYNPQVRLHLAQLARVVQADEAWLAQAARQAFDDLVQVQGMGWLELAHSGWQALPLALQRRVLRTAVATLLPSGAEVGFATLEAARQVALTGQVGAVAQLPGDVRLLVGYGSLQIRRADVAVPTAVPQLATTAAQRLPIPGAVTLADGWRLTALVVQGASLMAVTHNENRWRAFVATAATALWVRPRQQGERFQPLGLDGQHAALKKVMIGRRIPAALRAYWPIVANAAHLLWVVGYDLDHRARVTAVSQRIVVLDCIPPDAE